MSNRPSFTRTEISSISGVDGGGAEGQGFESYLSPNLNIEECSGAPRIAEPRGGDVGELQSRHWSGGLHWTRAQGPAGLEGAGRTV